jgi:hypothetical protein
LIKRYAALPPDPQEQLVNMGEKVHANVQMVAGQVKARGECSIYTYEQIPINWCRSQILKELGGWHLWRENFQIPRPLGSPLLG